MYVEIESGSQVWSVVYDKAIRDDGSLLFPQRLTLEFLQEQKRTMGSYIFANQYLNEIIPGDERVFKPEWIKYYNGIPELKHTFAFVDPAIGQESHHDFTALVVVHIDQNSNWYVEKAQRFKINATEIVKLLFDVHEKFKPQVIGIEIVAYQEALLHFLNDEMRKRNKIIPVHGVKRGPDRTKEQRIQSLVPRLEWGYLFLNRGLEDLEDELSRFPRAKHDDLIDSLASIEDIIYKPHVKRGIEHEPSQNSARYEQWYIEQLNKTSGQTAEDLDY